MYEAFFVANFSCSGISPGKSSFGALTRFPLQSGQGMGATGPKYFFGRVPAKFEVFGYFTW